MNIKTDFLVIGSGIAGLWWALRMACLGEVVLVTKKQDTESNTNYAQGGIAAVVSSDDTPALHIEDTLRTGAGLSHPEVVRKVVQAGPHLIQKLIDLGVPFTRDNNAPGLANLAVGKEGGHSRNRVVHAADATGRAIERVLVARAKENPRIKILEDHLAIDFLVYSDNCGRHCVGAQVLNIRGQRVQVIEARVTMLATGGCGQVYLHTTNPLIATGDGIAMAYRAGAAVANLEFMQFHPTALCHPLGNWFLISEALRGEGAKLRLSSGETFMKKYHPQAELAPRDIVARAIDVELKKRHEICVYLDATHLAADFLKKRFPEISERCRNLGIDIASSWIPVVPAAHYMCGGVLTDEEGKTTVEGLYASGEVACTGMHGANRLASNSLLEAIAFADFAAAGLEQQKVNHTLGYEKSKPGGQVSSIDFAETQVAVDLLSDNPQQSLLRHRIRQQMWDNVGIVRSDGGLQQAQRILRKIRDEVDALWNPLSVTYNLIELRNLATVAWLIVTCAVQRKESRGLHYNCDHPDRDDHNWAHDTVLIP